MNNFFTLYQMIGIGMGIIGFCTILWFWGERLEHKAQNPLKGLLDDDVPDTAKRKLKGIFGPYMNLGK